MTEAQKVRIIFTAGKSWFSRLIRWFTKGRVSHVFVEFPVWGQDCAVEATIGGTRLVLSHKARHDVAHEFEIKNGVPKIALIHMMRHLGTPYDYAGVLVIAWVRMLWSWCKFKVKSLAWSSRALKCSELVFLFLLEVGVTVESEKELISPEDVFQTCLDRPDVFKELVDE